MLLLSSASLPTMPPTPMVQPSLTWVLPRAIQRREPTLLPATPPPFCNRLSPLSLQTFGGPLLPPLAEIPFFSLSLQKAPPFPLKGAFSPTPNTPFQNSLSSSPPSYFSFPDTAPLTRLALPSLSACRFLYPGLPRMYPLFLASISAQ